MTGTLDTLLTLVKAEDDNGNAAMLLQKKQKRIRKGEALAFRIEAFDAGTDDDGDIFTVPMAVPYKHDNSLVISDEKPKKSSAKPAISGARANEVLRLLKAMAKHDPEKWFSQKEIVGLVGEPFNDIRENQDTLRRAVSRTLGTLEKAGSVEKNGTAYRYASGVEVIEDDPGADAPTLH